MDKALCFLLNTKIEVLLDPLMEIIYFLSRKRVNHSPRTSRPLTFCANVLFGHLLTIRDYIYLLIYICFLLCFAIERKRGSPFPEGRLVLSCGPRMLHMKYITDVLRRHELYLSLHNHTFTKVYDL